MTDKQYVVRSTVTMKLDLLMPTRASSTTINAAETVMNRPAFDNDLLHACDRTYGWIAAVSLGVLIGVFWYACVAFRAGVL